MIDFRRQGAKRAAVLLAAGIAFIAAFGITAGHGPGLDPDSMAYVGAATSLAQGHGLRVPLGKWEEADSSVELTVWPPAFSAAMALPQLVGASPMLSARLVLAASAAATAGLLVIVLAGATGIPYVAAALAIVLVTPSFVTVQMSVLSEPLFIASLALALFAMVRGRAGLAAAAATAAVMTRYAGASVAVAAAVWFLWFETGSARRRIMRAAISSAPAAMAFVLWMIHNSRAPVVQSQLKVGYYPGALSTLHEGLETILGWVAPGAPTPVAAAAGFLLIGFVSLGFSSRRRDGEASAAEWRGQFRVSTAAAVLLVTYLAVLIASRLFVGGAIRFDARILAPAIFLLEALIIPPLAALLARSRLRARVVASFAAALWIAAAVAASAPVVLDSIQDGNDFAASDWRESELVAWMSGEGRQYRIYTNWPAAAFFDAHRNAFDLPTSTDPDTLALLGRILQARQGMLAAFNERSFDYPPIDSIAAGAGLTRVREFSDGTVWAPKNH